MSACAMQTFSNVTQSAWQSVKQTVAAKFGLQITTDFGNITADGFTVYWNYDAATEMLSIQCTDRPFFIPCSMINPEIHEMVEAALNQHNIAIAPMVRT
jgi:hypothetical protein